MAIDDRTQLAAEPSGWRPIRARTRDRRPVGWVSRSGSPHSARGRAPAPKTGASRVGEQESAGSYRAMELADAKQLVTDLRVGFMLANEARYRTLERLFGVRRDQANLLTLVVLGMLLQATHDKADQWLRGIGGPTRADAVLGAGVFKELLCEVGGPASRDTPAFGTLVVVGLVGGMSGPALRRSLRGITTFSHRARASFNHRYGRLIGAHGDHPRGS